MTNWMWFSVALVKLQWPGTNWHVFNQSECRNCDAESRIWKVLPNMVFLLIWGGKWRRSEQAHASYPGLSFACLGSAPIGGGKKGEFRDWTRPNYDSLPIKKWYRENTVLILPLSGNSQEADQLVPMWGLVFVQSSFSWIPVIKNWSHTTPKKHKIN